ncbi:hypothetical protein [Roseibium sp. MMSF_3544]|uniref:hypothetical protein n=1 Tax=unclassified Roseibium TaxID=2629323 RepID=UPI00273D8450|nr:hypothetical protein [Roseibium sp. MMSF_3544]
MFFKPTTPSISRPVGQRSKVLALSTAMVLISGTAFAQDTGKAAFDAYAEGLKKLGLTFENGSVDYDAGTDTLTLTDSKLSLSGTIKDIPKEETDVTGNDGPTDIDPSKLTDLNYEVSISSGTVTITGLTRNDDTYTSEKWVYSDDTALVVSGEAEGEGRLKMEGRLSGITATNYEFVLPELPAEDPARQVSRWLPFVKASLLTSYDEVRVDSSGITIEAYGTENGEDTLVLSGTVQMDGYVLAGARDGRVDEYSIDQVTQNIQTLDPASGEMLTQTTSQGKTIYNDIDMAGFFDLFDPSVPESGQERTLLGSGSAVDYKSTQEVGDGITIKIEADRATLDNVTMVKRENDVLGLLDDLLDQKAPSPEELITDIFQFYRSFTLGDARISGVSVIVPIGPGLESAIKIEEMAMTNIGSSGIGEMMLVGLDAPNLPEGASVKLDWAAIGDIEFAEYTPMKAMIATLMSDPNYGEDNPIEVARAFVPRSFAYELEGLDVTIPDVGQTAIGKAEMTISSTVPPIPTSLHVRSDGIRVPVSVIDEPEAQALFQALGLDTVVWSDETRFYWDEATLELRLERLMVDIEGVGRAEASARFANVPKALFEDPEGQGQIAAISAQFVDASLSFKDAGLASKGLEHFAEAQGLPAEVLREVLIAQATEATAPIQNEAFTKMVTDAVSKFLNDPKDLSVTLAPANPVPLAQILGSMAAPQTLPDLLNVKVVAN